MLVNFTATLDMRAELYETPRDLRERFVEAMREAIQRAWQAGQIDTAQAEELWRALPESGRA